MHYNKTILTELLKFLIYNYLYYHFYFLNTEFKSIASMSSDGKERRPILSWKTHNVSKIYCIL